MVIDTTWEDLLKEDTPPTMSDGTEDKFDLELYEVDSKDPQRLYGLEYLAHQIRQAQAFVKATDSRRKDMRKVIDDFEIQSEDDLKFLMDLAGRLTALSKKLDGHREKVVMRFSKGVAGVNAAFKTAKDDLEHTKKTAVNKIQKYQAWLELKRREEEKRIRAQAEAEAARMKAQAEAAGVEAPEIPKVIIPQKETVRSSTGGSVHTRKVWTFELEDIGKVPQDLLLLNEKEIRARINAGIRDIPGLRIFKEEKGVFRG